MEENGRTLSFREFLEDMLEDSWDRTLEADSEERIRSDFGHQNRCRETMGFPLLDAGQLDIALELLQDREDPPDGLDNDEEIA